MVPTLGATGPARVGEPGELRVTGAAGKSRGFFVVGLTQTNLPDCPGLGLTCYTTWDAWFLIGTSGPSGAPGEGSWTMPYVVPAIVANLPVYHQAVLRQPDGVWTVTNGLLLDYK